MCVRTETRADEFLDGHGETTGRKVYHQRMMESGEVSQLRSRLNQVSAQSKNIPVSVEHLVALAETLVKLLDKILYGIEDVKKLQRHG